MLLLTGIGICMNENLVLVVTFCGVAVFFPNKYTNPTIGKLFGAIVTNVFITKKSKSQHGLMKYRSP